MEHREECKAVGEGEQGECSRSVLLMPLPAMQNIIVSSLIWET